MNHKEAELASDYGEGCGWGGVDDHGPKGGSGKVHEEVSDLPSGK